jgi:hypothetical protein
MKRWISWLIVSNVSLYMLACGDGDPPLTPSPPPPPPPTMTTTVVGEDSIFLPTHTFWLERGSTGDRGELKANVNWSVAEAKLWMYLADGACTVEKFQKDVCPFTPACECEFLAKSEAGEPKPRRLRVQNFGPGGFAFIVWNVGTIDTSSSWQLLLTTTSATTLRALPSSLILEGPQTAKKHLTSTKGTP